AVREGGAFEYAHALPGSPAAPKSDGSAPAVVIDALPASENKDTELTIGATSFGDVPRSTEDAAPLEEEPLSQAPTVPEPVAASAIEESASEDIKRVGPLEISHGLYSIFLTEADECIRVLANDIAEWR